MNSDRFERWLQTLAQTQDEEISCTECFELVSVFVDLELAGEAPQVKLPQLQQHLTHCPACRAEYEILRDLRQLEEEGRAPSLEELERLIP
jgi:predicted anti-sigma-YlaC factor YlaD